MKSRRIAIVIPLILSFLLANSVPAQSASSGIAPEYSEKIREIEQFVDAQMKAEGTVGMSIGFIKDDFLWIQGFGYADIENRVPSKADSSYRMASVTKPMTAVGILTLVEQGKIDLDAEVQAYVSYFPRKKYPVTVRQLLGHLGGISHYRNYDLEGHFKDHKDTREAIAVFEDFELVAEPGTRYNYSSYGFNLLGAVIEGASGMPYGEYMTKNVWKPLGMNHTVLDDPLEVIPNRVRGYQLSNGKVKNSEFIDISSRFAAGGIRSTVPDMLNFGKGMFEGKLLSAETRSVMWTAQATKDGRDVGYGLGWGTNTQNGRFLVGHGGSQQETKTYLLVAPKKRFAVAVAINFEPANPSAYAQRVFEIILGEPWNIRYYAPDADDRALLSGMDNAFDFGMRYFDQHGSAMTKDGNELTSAFVYFNDAANSKGAERLTKLSQGVHPVSGNALVKVVSHMASELKAANPAMFDGYYRKGVLALFNDYIELYRSKARYPAAYEFPAGFENKVAKWNADWARSAAAGGSGSRVDLDSDLDAFRSATASKFKDASVYPDHINDLEEIVRGSVAKGDVQRALKAANLAVELYPDSGSTNGILGVLLTVTGSTDKAVPLLRKSFRLDPNGPAGPRGLNAIAYDMAGIGQSEAALRLLMVAIDLHPKIANLYDSIGEFHTRFKNREKAIEFYEKALALDPNYSNAENARKHLAALKAEVTQ